MKTDSEGAEQGAREQPRGLFPSEWALLSVGTLLLLYAGVDVIVTHQAHPGRGFGRGLVTLDPVSAWITGMSLIAVGAMIVPVAYYAAKRHKRPPPEASGSTHRIQSIDALFSAAVLLGVFAWGFFVRTLPVQWSLLFAATLASLYVFYKIARLILEYRSSVSVHFGLKMRDGPDYERSAQPKAFWWAMGLEVVWLLVGGFVAVLLWMAFAAA